MIGYTTVTVCNYGILEATPRSEGEVVAKEGNIFTPKLDSHWL